MVSVRPGGTAATLTLLSSVLALSACGGNATTPPAADRAQQAISTHQSLGSARGRCLTTPCVYVANQDGGDLQTGSVTIYAAAASGNVAPLHTIVGEGTGLVGPVRIALDASHNVYVTNNASGGPGSVNVYAVGAYGDVGPIREIAGSSTGLSSPWGITLDAGGNIYVTNTGTNSVTVYASGADGNVAPIRTISGANTGLSSPTGIALGANGKITVSNIGNRSVTEYAANANGNVAPSKTIIGANTGLDFPLAIAVGMSGNIYVANRDAGPSNIGALTVYAGNANGNVAPLHTIAGSATGLNQPSGIARTANATYAANPSATSITVYADGANGNVAPIRTISGSNTNLSTPTGVTVR